MAYNCRDTKRLAKASARFANLIDPSVGTDLRSVDVLTCGTGLQSVVILALLQAYAEMEKHVESIMLIEEPEVYLHPDLQHKMFATLRKIAKDTQVIYTTHSPIMISELWADESVRLVKREAGESKFIALDLQGVISELGIRYDDVLNPRAVVFTEGDSDVRVFSTLVKRLYPQYANSMDRRIKFIPSDGYRTIHAFALMKIMYSDRVRSDFFVIADSDGCDYKERADNLVKQIRGKVPEADRDGLELLSRIKVLSEHEIESYFMDVELLSAICPQLKRKEVEYMLDIYKKKYDEAKEVYKKSPKTNQDRLKLVKYRPSSIFEIMVGKERAKFLKLYDDDEKFGQTKDCVAQVYYEKLQNGENPVELMINGIDIEEHPRLCELAKLVRRMIEETEEKGEVKVPNVLEMGKRRIPKEVAPPIL